MTELKRPETLASAVANHIGEAIIRGTYSPGSPLPEVRLATELDTSRGTVREALRALQDLGLVEIKAHRGATVAQLSFKRAEEILTLRAVLESWAARLAVERGLVTPEKVREMEDALQELHEAHAAGDGVAVLKCDMRFHRILASCCGHELLLEHLERLRMQTRQAVFYARLHDAIQDPISDHAPLLDAITSGDPDIAEKAVRTHIESSGQVLLSRMERFKES